MKPQQHRVAAERSKARDSGNKPQVATKPGDWASTAPSNGVRDSWRTGMRR